MTKRENILQELSDLNSTLSTITPQNLYTVPAGYFDGLITTVLNRIKAMEAKNAADELSFLSASLSNMPKQMPYVVPGSYFETLPENLLNRVRESNDYQTAKEELESISPLLSGLKKTNPYSVPQGYFESLNENRTKPAVKVISLTHRKWFKYAAAAVVTGLFITAGFIFMKSPNRIDPAEDPYAWVKKNIKTVDKEDIDAFIKLANDEQSIQPSMVTSSVKPDEIKELMKDVSSTEIQEFLDETAGFDNADEVMLN